MALPGEGTTCRGGGLATCSPSLSKDQTLALIAPERAPRLWSLENPCSASFSGEDVHGILYSSVVGFVVRSSNLCSAGSFFGGRSSLPQFPLPPNGRLSSSRARHSLKKVNRGGPGMEVQLRGTCSFPPGVVLGELPDVKLTQVFSGPALDLPMFIDL